MYFNIPETDMQLHLIGSDFSPLMIPKTIVHLTIAGAFELIKDTLHHIVSLLCSKHQWLLISLRAKPESSPGPAGPCVPGPVTLCPPHSLPRRALLQPHRPRCVPLGTRLPPYSHVTFTMRPTLTVLFEAAMPPSAQHARVCLRC